MSGEGVGMNRSPESLADSIDPEADSESTHLDEQAASDEWPGAARYLSQRR